MNHDFTLLSKAAVTPARSLPPDIRALHEHIDVHEPRSFRLRQSVSSWFYQLADRIAPRPPRTERDELFDAIAALLAEPSSDCARLEPASQPGCPCVL